MLIKKCSSCQKEKPIIEFYKDHSKKDGYRPRCKECRNNECINRKKEYGKEKNKRMLVYEYLKDKKCIHCSESNILCLEFDHIDKTTKKAMVSKLMTCSEKQFLKKLINVRSYVQIAMQLKLIKKETQ